MKNQQSEPRFKLLYYSILCTLSCYSINKANLIYIYFIKIFFLSYYLINKEILDIRDELLDLAYVYLFKKKKKKYTKKNIWKHNAWKKKNKSKYLNPIGLKR